VSVGVAPPPAALALHLAPNPTSDVVRWSWAPQGGGVAGTGNVRVDVRNALGQCVAECPGTSGSLSVREWAAGTYEWTVWDGTRCVGSQTLVVTR